MPFGPACVGFRLYGLSATSGSGRDPDIDGGSTTRSGFELKGSADECSTLSHSGQAHAPYSLRSAFETESGAVVVDNEEDHVVPAFEYDLYIIGRRMLVSIIERLLHYPVEICLDRCAEPRPA